MPDRFQRLQPEPDLYNVHMSTQHDTEAQLLPRGYPLRVGARWYSSLLRSWLTPYKRLAGEQAGSKTKKRK